MVHKAYSPAGTPLARCQLNQLNKGAAECASQHSCGMDAVEGSWAPNHGHVAVALKHHQQQRQVSSIGVALRVSVLAPAALSRCLYTILTVYTHMVLLQVERTASICCEGNEVPGDVKVSCPAAAISCRR